jgi:type VI protein secretion system component Hcp
MAKQTKKAGANRGRKKVQVKDLSKSEENLSAKRMKRVKGGIVVTKTMDSASPLLFNESLVGTTKKTQIN